MSKTFADLVAFLAGFSHDPYKFVMAAFPWGEKGTELERMSGPDEWQKDVLNDIRDGLKDPSTVIREAVASGNGIGKAQRLTDVIDTPNGPRTWGDIRPGDYVFGSDGNATKVIQCRRYESIPFYRVHFDDGAYLDVSSGHLWAVKGRNERRRGKGWRVMSTLDIVQAGVTRKSGSNPHAKQWEIPIQGAVEYPARAVSVPPYYLGVWIGDGGAGSSRYTKPYPEIQENLEALGLVCNRCDGDVVYVHGMGTELRSYGLLDLRSSERFIPDVYKYNTAEIRRDVLRGLMDTDGEVNKAGSLIYSTTSRRLADDVMWMVRSLGGKARMQPTNKQGWYYKDGKRVDCRECYRITMTLPFNPFSIKHRKERYKADIQHRYRARYIASIEPVGEYDGMCITVDNDDGLYQARDFIVTHNSAIVSWIIIWAMATHEDTRGVVTANTEAQLRAKTWAELSKWYRLFIARDMFTLTATSIFCVQEGHERTWRVDAIPWSKDNPEAFAGLHNQGKRILMLFDEASAIYDEIWNVAEGAMTDADTEIVWCAFGNPTRPQGKFYECFHSAKAMWHTRQIDSRNVAISNKQQLREWEEQYGEDSDFFKVHVRGIFPSASDNQLISRQLVDVALRRELEQKLYKFAPVIIGVDPAWTGGDMLAIVMRQGLYSKVLELMPKNDNDLAVGRRIAKYQDDYGATAVFIDMGYGTGIYSVGRDMGRSGWRLVSFAEAADGDEYANKRAEMWAQVKKWLEEGGSIDDEGLADELTGPEAYINRRGKLQLESKDDMKKRGLASPNMADALALTFAFPVHIDGNHNAKYRRARRSGKLRRVGTL